MSHTPGPWTFDPAFFAGDGVYAPDGERVPRSSADRFLIAAAPELLAVLESVTDWLDAYYTEAPPEFEADVEAARAAIAKAKGEP